MSTQTHAALTLQFSGETQPALSETAFQWPGDPVVYRAMRTGKPPKGFGKFDWRIGVQSLCYVLLRYLIYSAKNDPNQFHFTGVNSSGKGESPPATPVASLDRLLAKKTAWLKDIFGYDKNADCHANRVFIQSNPEGKRRQDPFGLRINVTVLQPAGIRVIWHKQAGGEAAQQAPPLSPSELQDLYRKVEMQYAALRPGYNCVNVGLGETLMPMRPPGGSRGQVHPMIEPIERGTTGIPLTEPQVHAAQQPVGERSEERPSEDSRQPTAVPPKPLAVSGNEVVGKGAAGPSHLQKEEAGLREMQKQSTQQLPAIAGLRKRDLIPKKISEWIWEDRLPPSAAFLNDDVVVLGGFANSLTVVEFTTRRVLHKHRRKELKLDVESDLVEKKLLGLSEEPLSFPSKFCVPGKRPLEPYPDARSRLLDDLRLRLYYQHMVISPDQTLLVCYRDTVNAFGFRQENDVWDVLNAEKPELVITIPCHKTKSASFHPNPEGGRAWSFGSHSGELILEHADQHSSETEILVVHSRTGELIKCLKLGGKGLRRKTRPWVQAPRVWGVLARPGGRELAVLYGPILGERWGIVNVSGQKGMKLTEWPPGPAAIMPGGNHVVCCCGRQVWMNETARSEIWEWGGPRLLSIPRADSCPSMVTVHPNGRAFVVVSTSSHTTRKSACTLRLKDDQDDVLIEAFSTKSAEATGLVRLQLGGRPLAFRVCADGQIRGVTSLHFSTRRPEHCRMMSWVIDGLY